MDQEIPEISRDRVKSAPEPDIPNLMTSKPTARQLMPNLPNFPIPRKPLLLGLAFFLLLFVLLGLALGLPLYKTYQDGLKTYTLAKEIKAAAAAQDLPRMEKNIQATKNQLAQLNTDLQGLTWATPLPILGVYISDAQHFGRAGMAGLEAAEVMTKSLQPYADLLGFKGQGSFTGWTAEERIAKLVETLDKLTPQIDTVADKMEIVKNEIDFVDPQRYPETFKGKALRSQIVEFKSIVSLAGSLLKDARPLVKKAPDLLGAKNEVKYLILFQNDKELRPTGGFITAYAVFKVNKGKISLESSDDIYKLDDTVTKHVTPPDPISKYLNIYGWRLRDANFSPDYASSSKTFLDIYANSPKRTDVQGVIAVDTQTLVRMMDILGPINIYGTNFTTQKVPQCDCPMIVYELLKQAGQPRSYWTDDRKDMIGILLQAIMKKALDAPSQMNAALFQAALKLASEKHLIVYLLDPDAQKGVEVLGFAGQIKTYDGDYLHVNDANLGGAKANLYIQETVKDTVEITTAGANHSLTIEYRYPHGADNCSLERKEGLCLAGIYRDYLRLYLPLGTIVGSVRIAVF